MKRNIISLLAVPLIAGAVALGGLSGCAVGAFESVDGIDHVNRRIMLRNQLKTHGEFKGKSEAFEKYRTLYIELEEKRKRGEVPVNITNVNAYYDWLKQQEGKQKPVSVN